MTKAASELRLLEGTDMETRLSEAQKELFNLRFQLATGRLDNFGRISTVKREIARILTLQQEEAAGFVPRPRVSTHKREPKLVAPVAKNPTVKAKAKDAAEPAAKKASKRTAKAASSDDETQAEDN